MKASLMQENFSPALSTVSRFVSSRTQLPILNNILIATDRGRLKLSATNLEIGISYWIGGKIDTEGSFTVPAKELTEFVSYLPVGKIDIGLNPQNLFEVSSSKAKSTFTTAPSSDYPGFPSVNESSSLTLPYQSFSSAINNVSFAASTDDSRPVLTSILCIFSTDSFKLVATDGFRLSIQETKLADSSPSSTGGTPTTFLIPAKSLQEVSKMTKGVPSISVGLSQDGHQLLFLVPDIQLSSRLIEGEFPDYQRIIPPTFSTTVNLSTDEFLQAIKIASVFARESANVVKLTIKNGQVDVSANAVQVGHNKVSVDAKVTGEGLEVAFNYKFISDFLSICQSTSFNICLNESLTPGLFQDLSNPTLTHIIMPVRIQD